MRGTELSMGVDYRSDKRGILVLPIKFVDLKCAPAKPDPVSLRGIDLRCQRFAQQALGPEVTAA